jgi:hypothetical protein
VEYFDTKTLRRKLGGRSLPSIDRDVRRGRLKPPLQFVPNGKRYWTDDHVVQARGSAETEASSA